MPREEMGGAPVNQEKPVLTPEERARKYWIKGGVKVRIKGGYGPEMEVMHVISLRRRMRDGTYRSCIEGVVCSFIDPFDGSETKKRFHTSELQPA